MAITTSAVNACDASIWLDDVNGVAQEISGSSNSVDLNFDHNLGEFVAFQEQWTRRLECGKDASFTLSIIYSETANEGWDVIKDWYFATSPGTRQLTIYIPDKNVGSDKFECQARIENFSFTADRGEPSATIVSATLLPDGEVTHSDVAT